MARTDGLIPMRDDADVASLHRRGELELSDCLEDVNVVDRAKPTKHGRFAHFPDHDQIRLLRSR